MLNEQGLALTFDASRGIDPAHFLHRGIEDREIGNARGFDVAQRTEGPAGVVIGARIARAVILGVQGHIGEADVAARRDDGLGGFLCFFGFGRGVGLFGCFFLVCTRLTKGFLGCRDAPFLFETVNFNTLELEEIQEAGLFGRTRVVGGKDPGGRAFGAGFFDGTLALQIKVVEEFLAAGGDIVHAQENGALLHVDVVARRPFHFGEGRIGTIPLATGVGRAKRADAGIGTAIAKGLVETANGVVIVGDGKQIVGGPAVIEAVRPHADDAALGHFLNFVMGHLLPLADDDGIQPGIVGAGAGHDVKIRDGLVEIVHDRGMPVEESLEHVAGEGQADAKIVAVIVVGNVVTPPDEGIGRLVGVLFVLRVDVHHTVVAIGFDDGSDQHDCIAADFLDEGCVFHSETVGEFHEHLWSAGFGRVDAAVSPVNGLAFGDELLRFRITEATGICEARGNFLVAIESSEIGFVGDRGDEHLAAFLGRADAPDFDPGAPASEQAEIGVDVLGVIENVGLSHDVMKRDIWRGNTRTNGKMVDEFGAEVGCRSEFFDFLGVLGVVAEDTGAGLGQAGCSEKTEKEYHAEKSADHRTPQGKSIAGDYISCLVLRRNPIAGVSTMGGLLTYDWPPAQAVGVLLQKSKKKDVPERRLRVEERDRRTVKEKHRRGCPRC